MSQQPNGHLHGTYGEAPVGTMAAAPHVPDYAPDPVRQALLDVRHEVAKAVVGQDSTVTGMLIALLSRGHVLLEGVPGVAKTLLVRALSAALSLDTKRVQFTPDLMPGDVTGSLVYDARTSEFTLPRGPGLHQHPAGRRNQPHAAQDPGFAAGGHGGTPGRPWTACPAGCPPRSSWRPRRTPWSTRAPTRCPRPSWTASCSS